MNTLRVGTLASMLMLGLLLVMQVPSTGLAAGDRILTGELVIHRGTANQFHLVDHEGTTLTAPPGTSLYEFDGKPVQVEMASNGQVLRITEMPIRIEPIEHGFQTVSGQLVMRDAVMRTFTIAGDDRYYTAPMDIDLRPYAGRMVDVYLDDRGQVTEIHFSEHARMAPPPVTNTCSYNGRSYLDGGSICRTGIQYRCDDGLWRNLGTACLQEESSAGGSPRVCVVGDASVAEGSSICRAGSTYRCVDGSWVLTGTACS